MENNIIKFEDLYNSLPEDQKTEDVKTALHAYYERENEIWKLYAERATKPKIICTGFRKAGSQNIAEFEVLDLQKEYKPGQVNFHLQNTSQWLYAGCFLVEDNRVSTHH